MSVIRGRFSVFLLVPLHPSSYYLHHLSASDKLSVHVAEEFKYSKYNSKQCWGTAGDVPTDYATATAACNGDGLCSCVSCNNDGECTWYKKDPERTVQVGKSPSSRFKDVSAPGVVFCAPDAANKPNRSPNEYDDKFEVSVPKPGTVRVTNDIKGGWGMDLSIKCLDRYTADMYNQGDSTAFVRGPDRYRPCEIGASQLPSDHTFGNWTRSSNTYTPIRTGDEAVQEHMRGQLNTLKVCDENNKVDTYTPVYDFWRKKQSEYKLYVRETDGDDDWYNYGCKLGFSDDAAEYNKKKSGWTPSTGRDVKKGYKAMEKQMEACRKEWIHKVKIGRDEGDIDMKERRFSIGYPSCDEKGVCTDGSVNSWAGKWSGWLKASDGIDK